MTLHSTLFTQFREQETTDPFAKQNSKLLKVQMGYGPVWARTGSMVAYQGQISFKDRGSGGLGKMFKSAVTGEGVPLMECTGSGELFLANSAREVQILYLDNDSISVNGSNVLAFSHSISWDIHRIQARGAMMAGDLYNVVLSGTGYVALTTDGEPVALDIASAPTFADAQAVVMWTSGVRMDVKVDTGGIGSMLRGGTGEMVQMAFSGQGHVLVQPAENVSHGSGKSAGGGLGGMFD
ncbi:AIM24 family protein [Kribbia dieselivorans]|uniref:AIM24 family protein n=1 Tax=Kribbia dieselivorans TaxID=331526 RepID=UPI000837CD5B|nr:AIM24 family protein [Kribbia dieselivorans]